MENAITDLLNALIPELGELLSDLRFWLGVVMVIGPVIMLLLGGYYLFLSPKEANHKAGYRTYFGMGSVDAWRFTQKLAGRVYAIAGGVTAIVAIVGCIMMTGKETADAVMPSMVILIIELGLIVVSHALIEIMVTKCFDSQGNRRTKKR